MKVTCTQCTCASVQTSIKLGCSAEDCRLVEGLQVTVKSVGCDLRVTCRAIWWWPILFAWVTFNSTAVPQPTCTLANL